MKKYNFSAGPSTLPESVFEEASEAVIEYKNTGLSILETSHRSPAFTEIIETAQQLALKYLGLENKGYYALFLHGGASMQFLMVAYNLLKNKAAYLNTGTWSQKAIQEAKLFGEVIEVGSSADKQFNYIPTTYSIPDDADYFHCTSNNTIYGTQLKAFPKTTIPIVCDMSSDIFSRNLDFSQFDLIYAGVQKNMGPAGAALAIIKEDILGKTGRSIPSMMDYQLHIAKKSVYNTAPVFPIYVSMLTLKWIETQGGIDNLERLNNEKATLLYTEIDRNPLFKAHVTDKNDRSAMNATFNLLDEKLKDRFDTLLKEANISGLKGHRSIGGYRASMYNAMPLKPVKILVDVMQEMERKA